MTATRKTARAQKPEPKTTAAPKLTAGKPKKKAAASVKTSAAKPTTHNLVVPWASTAGTRTECAAGSLNWRIFSTSTVSIFVS